MVPVFADHVIIRWTLPLFSFTVAILSPSLLKAAHGTRQ